MNEQNNSEEARRARIRNMALMLGAVALAFFVGFIFISSLR